VLTESSIAYAVARLAIEEGAAVVLTGAGRGLSLTKRVARRLPVEPPVLELDVTEPGQLADVAADLGQRLGALDGVLHSIGFAPSPCLGQGMFAAEWPDVAKTLEISTFSLAALARSLAPLLAGGDHPSIVGLDFDATVAWPGYDWMGVAKAGLESLTRYLARDLGPQGIRVNLVAAGPIRTTAAKSIPGFSRFEEAWQARSPLGWNINDATAAAKACVLALSTWLPATTGEILHVDGGYHALGA
jgi:enoyl-[acyl-carrier protein] reductase I